MTAAANKEALLALFKPKTQLIELPDGGTVKIRELTVDEVESVRDKIKAQDKAKKAGEADVVAPNFGLELLILSVLAEDGSRAFAESDLPAIRAAGNGAIDVLLGKVMQLNGFQKAPEEKNLPTTQSAASATA